MENEWREFLAREFSERKSRNPNYSLRAYAKALDLSPAHLSLILAGKRKVKPKSAMVLAQTLGLTPGEVVHWSTGSKKLKVASRELSTEEFYPISEWYYFAIRGLADFKDNVASAKWIAGKLGLDLKTAGDAFKKLVDLKYIEIVNGQFRQFPDPLVTSEDIPSALIRRCHKQHMDLAARKMDSVPVDQREFFTSIVAIDPKRMKAAKKMIRDFSDKFVMEMENGRKSEVYALGIQFSPITLLK